MHYKKAFTLVELMIVIAIIGILAAALFPSMTAYTQRARDSATQSNIRKLLPIIQNHLIDVGSFSGMMPNSWYCLPLKTGVTGCNGVDLVPNFPTLPLSVEDFSTQKNGYMAPLIVSIDQPSTITTFLFSKLLSGSTSFPKHVLHWTLPGNSGYTGPRIIEPDDISTANTRCVPGRVYAINHIPDQTACTYVFY